MNGFFLTDRQELFDLCSQIPPRLITDTIAVWTMLKARARWTNGYYQGMYLEAGQALFGRDELSTQLGISPKRVRTIIQHLKNLKKVTIKGASQGSIATIINPDTYKTDQTENGQRWASDGPATLKKLTKMGQQNGQPESIATIINPDTYKTDQTENGQQNGQQGASDHPEMGQKGATNNKENKIKISTCPPYPPTENQSAPPAADRERVVFTKNDPQPALRTDAELLPYPDDYDPQAVYAHYLKMKQQYHRTRFLDVQVDRALRVLVRDPEIEPRLTQADMMALVEKWMQWGSPWHAEDLWREDPKRRCPWWETLVHTGNHRPKFTQKPDDEDLDEWIKQNTQPQERIRGPRK